MQRDSTHMNNSFINLIDLTYLRAIVWPVLTYNPLGDFTLSFYLPTTFVCLSRIEYYDDYYVYLICVRQPPWWDKRVWDRGVSSWPCWAASWSIPCSSSGSWWPTSCIQCPAAGIGSRSSPLSINTKIKNNFTLLQWEKAKENFLLGLFFLEKKKKSDFQHVRRSPPYFCCFLERESERVSRWCISKKKEKII